MSEQYSSFVSSLRRAKWLALSGLLVSATIFLPLTIFLNPGLAMPGLVTVAIWYFWFLPSHRKRLRAIYASMPKWEIWESSNAHQPRVVPVRTLADSDARDSEGQGERATH